jgi:tellurite resistance protein TerB
MWDKLKNLASNVLSEGEKVLTRAIDKNNFKRIIFAGYLIAQADGDFDSDEKSALAKIVKKELPQFDIQDIIDVINKCDEKVSFDKRLGVSELLDFIGGADKENAELIMRICCFIGEADGKFDADEKLVARDIAIRLNVTPSRYGL